MARHKSNFVMTIKSQLILLLTVLVFVFATSYILPALLISNGTENFSGQQKQRAEKALKDMNLVDFIGTSTKLKVVKIINIEGVCGGYIVYIQSYGLFGRKQDIWRVDGCGSSSAHKTGVPYDL